MSLTIPFEQVGLQDISGVGGKNASIGELIQNLSAAGVRVPAGFAITTEAYHKFLDENGLQDYINEALTKINLNDVSQLREASTRIKQKILQATMQPEIMDAIKAAYESLDLASNQSVAVRSSATQEDLPTASFAGQQETYLNVRGVEAVIVAVQKVYASLYTARAISYRMHQGFEHQKAAISVGVQLMVRSDKAASGVMFTIDTESGFEDAIFITGSYGLGELMVQGEINPDEFYVHKPMLAEGKPAIISRKLGTKTHRMIYAEVSTETESVQVENVSVDHRLQYCLSDIEILELAHCGLAIERHYGKAMDIEWAKDGITGKLYVVQARPETVSHRQNTNVLERYQLLEQGELITAGRSVGNRIGQGHGNILMSSAQIHLFNPGDVLVTDMTDPDWEPIMAKSSAIVTNRGGRTCHAAIIARELGIPAVVGCSNATDVIQAGDAITVSCAEGDTGHVYAGNLQFEVEKTEVKNLPEFPFKLCINLANPEKAFRYQALPNDGVGLARLEFIISNHIGIHPKLLLDYYSLPSSLQQQVQQHTKAYESPTEFYIEKLTEGIATIAAAFYPKRVIVRFSDFKSNEYAGLLGGDRYEPDEENPMLGYRGASRYLNGMFQECFLLECEAIRRVRNKLGLVNTQVMFPFVRTLSEAQALHQLMESQELVRGDNGLEMIMMCEIPANAILAEEFLEYFDGFSIGSNDLTQLTLGLDRDSALVADVFDERNAAVLALLQRVIALCRSKNKYIGICGQGPSDHLDFAQWLAEQGIDTISLMPDTIISTWLALARHKIY